MDIFWAIAHDKGKKITSLKNKYSQHGVFAMLADEYVLISPFVYHPQFGLAHHRISAQQKGLGVICHYTISMKPEQIQKLKSQITKGGFPFELEVARVFLKCKWEVENNTYYIDHDEKKGREIDIIAKYYKQFNGPKNHYSEFIFSFIIEIKKELEKPWVIFSTETTDFENAIYEFHSNKVATNFNDKVLYDSFKKHNQKLNKSIGRSFTEGFSNGRDKIFASLCNVTKAYIHKFESTKKDESTDSLLYYYEPLIVLNGQLFEAYLNKEDELDIVNREHIQFRFNYLSDYYKERMNGYIINIVTKQFLPEYIKLRSMQFDKIFEANKLGI